jgi:DNA-binding NarL/FixJ family response regulator
MAENAIGETILVAAVDDHPLILRGLQVFLRENAPDIQLMAIYSSVAALLEGAGEPSPSVVLLDLLLPSEPDVEENVRGIRSTGARVVILTSDSRPGIVHRAIDSGALGLVLKGDPEESLVEAVRSAHADEHSVSSRLAHAIMQDPRAKVRLSPREHQVLSLIARGLPRKLVAREMNLAVNTLPSYVNRALKRYADVGIPAAGPSELIAFALQDGHIEVTEPGLPRP